MASGLWEFHASWSPTYDGFCWSLNHWPVGVQTVSAVNGTCLTPMPGPMPFVVGDPSSPAQVSDTSIHYLARVGAKNGRFLAFFVTAPERV